MDMREAVIREVNSALAEVGIPKGWQWDAFEVVKITDRILAIPEIRDALALKQMNDAGILNTIEQWRKEPNAQP